MAVQDNTNTFLPPFTNIKEEESNEQNSKATDLNSTNSTSNSHTASNVVSVPSLY